MFKIFRAGALSAALLSPGAALAQSTNSSCAALTNGVLESLGADNSDRSASEEVRAARKALRELLCETNLPQPIPIGL